MEVASTKHYSRTWLGLFEQLYGFFFARLFGHIVCLRGESPLNQEFTALTWKQLVRDFVLRHLLFKLVNRFLFIGTQNRRFYQHFGVPDHKLIFTPYAVDNERFRREAKGFEGRKSQLRQLLGIPEKAFVVLYAGKFISKKRPLDLLKAVEQVPLQSLFAVFVGDGELRNDLERFIVNNELQQRVQLAGFVNQSEISRYYAAADAFVMCSGRGETWGLSINEAMNFGLPILTYDTVGCATDLVKSNKNGFVVAEDDVTALAQAITILAVNAEKCYQMGQASLKIIENYSIANIIAGLKTIHHVG